MKAYFYDQYEKSERANSQLSKELEEIKMELKEMRRENEELRKEKEELLQVVQEKEDIQTKMGEHINMVTETAYILHEKFRAFKVKHYEKQRQNAFLSTTRQN